MLRELTIFDVVLNALLGGLVVGGGLLMFHGTDPLRAYVAGTPGHVSVSGCQWVEEPRGDDGYECRGAFNGAGLRVESVVIKPRPNEEPVNPVPTVVTGPTAKYAWTPGLGLLGTFASGVVMAGIGLVYLWRVWIVDSRAGER